MESNALAHDLCRKHVLSGGSASALLSSGLPRAPLPGRLHNRQIGALSRQPPVRVSTRNSVEGWSSDTGRGSDVLIRGVSVS